MAKDKFVAEAQEEVREHGPKSKFGKLVAGRVLGSKASSPSVKKAVFGKKVIAGKSHGGK